MSTASSFLNDKDFLSRAIETIVRIGVLAILVTWCFLIIYPFIVPVTWGLIIAVAVFPAYDSLANRLGERRTLTAVLLTLLALAVLIVPAVMLAGTVVDGTQVLSQRFEEGSLAVPPPPESVAGWPIVGESVHSIWTLASVNLGAALTQIAPHLKALGAWLLSAGVGLGLGILQFVFAIIIAGVMLIQATAGGRAARAVSVRLSGDRGVEFANIAEATVRSVARGILGVALIQSVLAGLGFLVMGVPAAGIWALLCLVLAVIQIGPTLVLIPIVVYVFSVADPVPASLFMIWCIFVGVIDNILKPILLGRGVKVPMIIIFLGAIGGFIAWGIIGLFVGAVILTLGYELFVAWLHPGEPSMAGEATVAADSDTESGRS